MKTSSSPVIMLTVEGLDRSIESRDRSRLEKALRNSCDVQPGRSSREDRVGDREASSLFLGAGHMLVPVTLLSPLRFDAANFSWVALD